MERLTYWNEEYGCWSYKGPSGNAAILLAKYEDTGMTPDEIKELPLKIGKNTVKYENGDYCITRKER